jgi:hypothetical protein
MMKMLVAIVKKAISMVKKAIAIAKTPICKSGLIFRRVKLSLAAASHSVHHFGTIIFQ